MEGLCRKGDLVWWDGNIDPAALAFIREDRYLEAYGLITKNLEASSNAYEHSVLSSLAGNCYFVLGKIRKADIYFKAALEGIRNESKMKEFEELFIDYGNITTHFKRNISGFYVHKNCKEAPTLQSFTSFHIHEFL